jgi:predicted Na+-dependent transporter
MPKTTKALKELLEALKLNWLFWLKLSVLISAVVSMITRFEFATLTLTIWIMLSMLQDGLILKQKNIIKIQDETIETLEKLYYKNIK